MKFFFLVVLILARFFGFARQAEDSLKMRMVLVGNMTPGRAGPAFMNSLRDQIRVPDRTTLLFLGDNAAESLEQAAAMTDKAGATAIFLAGEKEWNEGKAKGYDSVRSLQYDLERVMDGKATIQPKNGCPGPEEIKLNDDVLLVLLNTQWWLHRFDKPAIESGCPTRSKEQVYDELDKILRENAGKLVIVAGHHPLESTGRNGGHFTLKQHLFPLTELCPGLYVPLPLIGSLYPVLHNALPGNQHLRHPDYENMVRDLKKALAVHPNVVYVSAHEQNLQLWQSPSLVQVVSGGGGSTTRVSRRKETPFVSRSPGFAVVDVYQNQRVKVSFYELHNGAGKLAFSREVLDYSLLPDQKDTVTLMNPTVRDSVTVPASRQYRQPSRIQKWLIGNNYRKEWETPVTLPVFDIQNEAGGFRIKKIGGGKQTQTLHLEDSSGRQYKVRTIDKDPQEFLPLPLRSKLTQRIVQDFISASHPYSALVVADLARQVGVVEARPRYFFMPNDTALGYYRPLFANKVVMLVEKDPRPFENTKSSFDIFNKTTEKADHVVDQQAVLKARLLDILTGDFDRHMGQWSWGIADTGKGKLYEPVPKDRDQAFFHSDGLLVRLAARNNLSLFKGFTADLSNITGLGFSAGEFDRTFLNALEENQWKQTIASFRQSLTDSVIEGAVARLPPEIYSLRGKELEVKLKSRRDQLAEKGLEYYRFISDNVNVLGSNEDDFFWITGQGGKVRVQVYESKNGDTVMQTYSRVFDPVVTKEIRLYGLNGKDHFLVDSTVQKDIRLRLIGGKEGDTFVVRSSAVTYIYDRTKEPNTIMGGGNTRSRLSHRADVQSYRLNSYAYSDKGGFPLFSAEANSEYGPVLSLAGAIRTFAFRKEPFASENILKASFAPARRSYGLSYTGVFNRLFGSLGLTTRADWQEAAHVNFFGLGNETRKDPSRDWSYYRVRYLYAAGELLLTRDYFSRLSVALGPTLFYYWNNRSDNKGKIIETPEPAGLDSLSVYSRRIYGGLKLQVVANGLDNLFVPTQGIHWKSEVAYLQRVAENGSSLARLQTHLTLASPLIDTSRLVSVVKVGGGHIIGSHFEFFQALGLGADNRLRGFRNNRFAGNSLAYGSLELRYRLLTVSSFFLPGDIGIIGFTDAGRVWMKKEVSRRWHTAWGGGVYYYPFQRLFLSATAGRNEEGAVFHFTIGRAISWYR